jgi:hypothetical protein
MTDMLQEFCDSRGVEVRVDAPSGVIRGVKLLILETLHPLSHDFVTSSRPTTPTAVRLGQRGQTVRHRGTGPAQTQPPRGAAHRFQAATSPEPSPASDSGEALIQYGRAEGDEDGRGA